MIKEITLFKTVEGKYVRPLVESETGGVYEDVVAVCYDDGEVITDKVLKKLFSVDGLKLFLDTDTNEMTVKLYNHNPEEE